jgi:DNA-binding Lrp family transcriptional regulator
VPQVRAVYVLTGNDDFLIHVAVPDLPALHALLMDHFSKRKEVIGFRTSVIYDYASQPLLILPPTE